MGTCIPRQVCTPSRCFRLEQWARKGCASRFLPLSSRAFCAASHVCSVYPSLPDHSSPLLLASGPFHHTLSSLPPEGLFCFLSMPTVWGHHHFLTGRGSSWWSFLTSDLSCHPQLLLCRLLSLLSFFMFFFFLILWWKSHHIKHTILTMFNCTVPWHWVLCIVQFSPSSIAWIFHLPKLQPLSPLNTNSPSLVLTTPPHWPWHLPLHFLTLWTDYSRYLIQVESNCICLPHPWVFSYHYWGSQGKNADVVCHSLLQWITFCQNSPPWPVHLGCPYRAWLIISLSSWNCDHFGWFSVIVVFYLSSDGWGWGLCKLPDGRDWLRGKLGLHCWVRPRSVNL